MLVQWCGTPVVIPGIPTAGLCLSPGVPTYSCIVPSSKMLSRPSFRYSDKILSYEPLVSGIDLYRNNMMVGSPRSHQELPGLAYHRRHSHDPSDFNPKLLHINNMNNLNNAKSMYNTQRKKSEDSKTKVSSLDIFNERKESKEELNRSRSILRRSSINWYRRKSRQVNQNRLSLPSLREPTRGPRPQNNYSSVSEMNRVRRSSTSVGDHRRMSNTYETLRYGNTKLSRVNSMSSVKNGTVQGVKTVRSKRVSVYSSDVLMMPEMRGSPESLESATEVVIFRSKNIDNRNSLSSSMSSSSSSNGSSPRNHTFQNRTLARIRGLQR